MKSKKINKPNIQQKLNKSAIFTLVIVLFLIGLLFLSYSNFYPPLVDKKYIFTLDSFVSSIPFIPKTPKQIITRSFYSNKKLSSYNANSSITLKGKLSDEISLVFSGKVNKAAQFGSESSLGVKGKVTGSLSGEIDFQTVAKNESFYFRTVGNLGIEDFDPNLLGKGWYQLDLDKFQTSLGVEAKKDTEIASDISEQAKKFEKDLIDGNIFSNLIDSKELRIDKERYNQFKFSIQEKTLNSVSLLNGYKLTNPSLTLLINKKTFYLEKLQINSEVVADNKGVSKEKMDLRLEYQIFDINKEQKIETPKASKIISHPVDLSLAFDGKEKGNDEELLAATEKAIDRGQNFLTIERILKVILLLPKTVYPE